MKKNFEFEPRTIDYLEQHHNRIWRRSAFSENSKCDYLTNNVSESFNAQIKKFKGLLLHELVDRIRELIMQTKRRSNVRDVEISATFKKTCKMPEVGEDGERAPPRSKAAKRYVFVH
jgi:thymidylate synthase